jgi:hypothetical protein
MAISPLLKNICIIGGGQIGHEYSKILSFLSLKHQILSRSIKFKNNNLKKMDIKDLSLERLTNFDGFIICVQPENTYEITKYLIKHTKVPLLIEKPISLSYQKHLFFLKDFDRIYVALNRRKYKSTNKVINSSFSQKTLKVIVEVTEIPSRKKGSNKVLNKWPLANTIHIIDLALYISGFYKNKKKNINIKRGSGVLRAVISNKDNYSQLFFFDFKSGTGNWGIEITTKKVRFILRPLEKLQLQLHGSIKRKAIRLPMEKFKDGFLENVKDFVTINRKKFINFKEYDFLIQVIKQLYN